MSSLPNVKIELPRELAELTRLALIELARSIGLDPEWSGNSVAENQVGQLRWIARYLDSRLMEAGAR